MLSASYDHILFAVAALFNLTAAATLLFKPEVQLNRLGIADPAARLLARSFVSSVATWGIGYAMIAVDPVRFRDFAWLGVLSKSLFFVIHATAFARGRLSRAAFLPALIDAVLAALFAEFFWRTGR